MSEDQDRDIEPGLSATQVAGGVESVLARITKRRDETESTQKFDIPSWDGDLKAEYAVLHRDDIEKMIRRAQARQRGNGAGGDHGVSADCDFLIKACIGVYVVDPEADYADLDSALVKIANGYELSLVEMLKPTYPKGHPQEGEPVPIKDERELVVYMLKWNSIALASHGQQVARWMQTMRAPVEDPQ